MSKSTVLVNHERMVLRATTVGFFYNYGKRQNVCNHKSCGWVHPENRACRIIKYASDFYQF